MTTIQSVTRAARRLTTQSLLALAIFMASLFAWSDAAKAASPSVVSVSVPGDSTYSAGHSLDFTVNFDQPVFVNTVGGTPAFPLTLHTGGTVSAVYVSGSGTDSLTFRYTVQPGDADMDGVTVGASISLNGGTINNVGLDTAVLTLNSVGSTSNVLVSAPVAPPAAVPTLTEWAMILLTGLLALFGAARLGLLPVARKS